MQKRSYQNPGELFIKNNGIPHDIDDIFQYADFLRQQADLGDAPPIDLAKIFSYFGISSHQGSLTDQQGVSDGLLGFVLVKEDDPAVRQRFSEAHELIEFLFHEYKNLPEWQQSYYATHNMTKEKLCQKGASALLMPRSSFVPKMLEMGVSFASASALSELYETSLLATLYRMIEECEEERLLVVWQFALKPTQEVNKAQPSLFGDNFSAMPEKKLRVWWAIKSAGFNRAFIPQHQSIHDDSIIVRAYETNMPQSGYERFQLQGIEGRFYVEAKKVTIGDKSCVLSLLHRLL